MKELVQIYNNQELLAIVIKNNYTKDGVEFFTKEDSPQQIAFMKHNKGKKIDAHIHNVVKREISQTQEVLIIKKGSLRVDFYDEHRAYIKSYILDTGDLILLMNGGHGFKCLDEVEMIEIKQGPYLQKDDKVRFSSINDESIILV